MYDINKHNQIQLACFTYNNLMNILPIIIFIIYPHKNASMPCIHECFKAMPNRPVIPISSKTHLSVVHKNTQVHCKAGRAEPHVQRRVKPQVHRRVTPRYKRSAWCGLLNSALTLGGCTGLLVMNG